MSATYEVMLVDKLRPHPKNIRHDVVAPAQLVASVRHVGILQPLVVAPHPTLDGDYTLIAGHHRLAAAKKVGLLEVPVIIRHDLGGDEQQIPAMVAENIHRKGLTVTEEVDAVQQMLTFEGWDAKRVASATGLSQTRVRERAKLAKLGDEHREALDAGQLTIERALVIAEYAGHPDLQAGLVKAAVAQPYNWEYEVRNAKTLSEWREKVPALRDVLTRVVGMEIVDRPEVQRWMTDYPFEPVTAETAEEAKKLGAVAILDDECAVRGKPEYVVPKGTHAKAQQADETEEERTAREKAEADRARVEAVEAKLATLTAVEDDWIRGIVSSAARDERTTRVIRRHAAETLAGHVFGYNSAYRAAEYLAAYFSIENTHGALTQDVQDKLAGLTVVELTTLLTIMLKRERLTSINAFKPAVITGDNSIEWWLAFRNELGWETTDVETEAMALAAELWPAAPTTEEDSQA
ncbi:MAG: ParB/RepB/Spo0J family partition protein [Micrococcus sp.]|nr:ParB/RepB/Spo0J family partition protein [Micrococcus sp.]